MPTDPRWEKARQTNPVADVNMAAKKVAACPHYGAKTDAGKFCPECGKPLASEATCTSCAHKAKAGTRLRPECGTKM